MSYNPVTDLFALLRTTSSGARLASVPGLDVVLAALARAGFITLWVDPSSPPAGNQSTTVWLKTSSSSWMTEGTVYLWDVSQSAFVAATPALWSALIQAPKQISNEVDPVASTALTALQAGYLYTNSGSGVIDYTLPPAVAAPGAVFEFVMTQNGSLNVLVANSGTPSADTLRWGLTTTTISALSTYIGSYLKVRSINGQWFVINSEGTWILS